MQSMESERKPIRLIGLDLDGTLLTSAKELTERTRAVLEELSERGIEIVPVTGRPLSGLPPEVRSLPGLRYAITSNGAVTYDLRDNRVLRSFYIRPENGYSDRETYERMVSFFQGRAALPYVLASRRPSDDILAFCEHPPIGIENIWIVTKDREARDALADHIRNTTKLHVMRTAERDVEAVHGSADKGRTASELSGTVCKHGLLLRQQLVFNTGVQKSARHGAAGRTLLQMVFHHSAAFFTAGIVGIQWQQIADYVTVIFHSCSILSRNLSFARWYVTRAQFSVLPNIVPISRKLSSPKTRSSNTSR